ncbi:MAG: sensor histidine kinase [Ekhidna sp.]|nr:sensor histidine kinase [Ekhidna sp.]
MSIQIRYFLFSALIVGGFVGLYVVTSLSVGNQQINGPLINNSGRQRMLSQFILARAYKSTTISEVSELKENWNRLDSASSLWQEKHQWLLQQSKDLDILDPVALLEMSLLSQRKVANMLAMKAQNDSLVFGEEELQVLEAEMTAYLTAMETIVGKYEKEAISDLYDLKNASTLLFVGLCIVMIGVFFLIFVPMIQRMRQYNRHLKSAADEKEFLYNELNHRVKNSLQDLASIITLESRRNKLDGPLLLKRIHSIGLAYSLLNYTDVANKIDLKDYVNKLTDLLRKEDLKISCTVKKIYVEAQVALDFGFIINELVTNSMKYAAPVEEILSIQMDLKRAGEDALKLFYRDNGLGYEENKIKKGLGLNIIGQFAEKHEGTFDKIDEKLAHFKVSFNHLELQESA